MLKGHTQACLGELTGPQLLPELYLSSLLTNPCRNRTGVYMNGGRSICHIRETSRVEGNDVGVLLMQRSCCHVGPNTVATEHELPEDDPDATDEQESAVNKVQKQLVKYHYCEMLEDNDGGKTVEKEEIEWSNTSRRDWEHAGKKSINDMRNRTCGVANVSTGPGGDCNIS